MAGTNHFLTGTSLPIMVMGQAPRGDAARDAPTYNNSDKLRNRNPNWTDHEIVRFLEILQEDDTMKDLLAQRNKQVFCYVAQRMSSEGAEKTWDQCRIKLKNLKSQYRYVKERIPNLDTLDLESDSVVKQLIADCQERGISPSCIKHIRFLRRFLQKQSQMSGAPMGVTPLPKKEKGGEYSVRTEGESDPEDSNLDSIEEHGESSVSPPTTPNPRESGIRIISADKLAFVGPASKKRKLSHHTSQANEVPLPHPLSGRDIQEAYRFIEKFNRDMMSQFMEHQRRSQATFIRWEQERFRLEQQAMERWRQEAREHEKQLFGMFCHVMTQCNSALSSVLQENFTTKDVDNGEYDE